MSTTTTLPNISLFYKEGTSDKEYHLTILGNDTEGYKVQYRYGRRGQTLKAKFKNPVPVSYEDAKNIYNDTEAEKRSEGYTTAPDGTPYVGTETQGRVSGLLPQLLNPIEEDQVQKYLNDDAWVLQEKKNGDRKMIKKTKKIVEGINRKGLVVSLPETVVKAIEKACGTANATFDGELVGEVYWLFDILSAGVRAFSNNTYRERLNEIQDWLVESDDFGDHFQMVPTAVGKASKTALYKKLKKDNAEGVVFKKLDSVYKAGRPASGGNQVKFKFMATATVRCKHLNDKSSFVMEMLSKGDWVEVGNCTFFPTKTVPVPGKLYEVEYMHAYPNGSLYGPPVLLNERTDVDEDACLVAQLKYKQSEEEEV